MNDQNELIEQKNINALEVFSVGGLQSILDKIKSEVNSLVPDIETAKGRKEIASLARKVASSKVALDNAGKDLVSEWKEKSRLVDIERKKARDFLDGLRDEVRKPLTEWEESEKKRIAEEELAAEIVQSHAEAIQLNDLFDRQKEIEKKERDMAEKERIEQERIDAENRAKAAAEREQKLKEDAANQAKKQAEEAAKKAIEEAKMREQEAIYQARREREEYERKERDRTEKEEVEKAEIAKREADKKHRATINRAALKDITDLGVSDKSAKLIVTAIAKGEVSNVRIIY